MASRRVYELARERGLTSSELLQRLERAGIRDKKPLSTLDEGVVDAALAPEPPAPAAGTKRPAPRTAPKPRPPEGPLQQRLRLRRLRRQRDAQLKELGGLAVELRRLDSPRYEELARERLEAAAATDGELMALERQLAPDDVGGVCPACGLHSSHTRFCLRCGEALPGRHRTSSLSGPAILFAIVLVAGSWILGGLTLGGSSNTRAPQSAAGGDLGPQPSRAAATRFRSVVATAKGSQVSVYSSPDKSTEVTTLGSPNLDGAPLAFLVRSSTKHWAHVLLPTRPNGSSGWIRLSQVTLAGHSYRVLINLDEHKLVAWNGARVVMRTPIGVGRAVTPTPLGLYYITELLKQPDPTGVYGPYAFGLSAHSDVLHEFAGRDGILGLHGTDYPQGIGTDVSHGCIRMSNHAIVKLAHTLPVGTPVRITRDHVSSA